MFLFIINKHWPGSEWLRDEPRHSPIEYDEYNL